MRRNHGCVHGLELGARGLKAGSGRKPAEYFGHAMLAALHHGGREVVRAGDDVSDNLCVRRVWNRGFKNSDNDRRTTLAHASQAGDLPKYVSISVQAIDPEKVDEIKGGFCFLA
jgi:hypothetical protein